MNVDALESLYIIFTDNIDSLYQEAKIIYDSKIKKDDKEEEKEEIEKNENKEKDNNNNIIIIII